METGRRPIVRRILRAAGAAILSVLLSPLAHPALADPPLAEPKAAEPSRPEEEEGDLAPEDCWVTRGGSLARSGESRTRPLRGEIEIAWTFEVRGKVEGEPRAWLGRLFVEEDQGSSRRVLHVLDASTGKESYRHVFERADRPLDACVWRDTVVVRSSPKTLHGFAVGQRMLTPRWKAEGADFSGPLLLGDEVYARDGPVVRRWRFGRTEHEWGRGLERAGGAGNGRALTAVGALALRGPSLYVACHDEQGNAFVAQLLRSTGTVLRDAFVGPKQPLIGDWTRELIRPGLDSPVPVVGSDDLLLRFAEPFRASGGGLVNAAWVERRPDSGAVVATRTLLTLAQDAAITGSTWVGVTEDPEDGPSLVRPTRTEKDGRLWFDVYASRSDHASWVDVRRPPVVARDVVHLGARAFETESRDVVREDDPPAAVRVVPLRGLLVLVDAEKSSVVAWREKRRPPPAAALVPAAPPGAAAGTPLVLEGATAILEEGAARVGAFALDPVAGRLSVHGDPKDKTSWALADVRAVLARGGELLFARDVGEAAKALDQAVARDAGKALAGLALDAVKAGDLELAREFHARAREGGAPAADLERAEKAIVKAAKGTPPKKENSVALRGRAEELAGRAGDALWRTFAALPEAAAMPLRAALLRELLARTPAHPGAVAWVRGRLPAGVAAPEPFDAGEWLRFVEAAAQTPLRVVELAPGAPERGLSASQRELGAARYAWRKDIVGLESGQLLMLTPVEAPGRIALVLSSGELVCDVLEKIFAGGTRKRDTRYPLVQLLCASREEYLGLSRRAGLGGGWEAGDGGNALGWTAGHYDPTDGVSRLFVPDREEAFEEVAHVYAHELTHHWIETRCPLFSDADLKAGRGGPGAWILEGFATFVEGFRFDLARREAETLNPRASALDLVAHAPDGALLPWATLFALDQPAAYGLSTEPKTQVPLRWRLGWKRKVSHLNLFYAQSAVATSYFFHAEDGRHRPALLAAVADWYTGRTKADDFESRFGAPADEIGRRIVAWARKTVGR